MTSHTDLLNFLATTFNLQSYLEIGVQNPANNFDKIRLPNSSVKFGVDPAITETPSLFKETSDEFFKDIEVWEKYFDLIFIDGLHHADQVKRDFENSLKCLTDNGFIVIHDTLPTDEKYTHVPRDSKIWFGDVYKFAGSLHTYTNLTYCTVNIDCGCTVVWKDDPECIDFPQLQINNWDEFLERKELLMIASVEEFKKIMTKTEVLN